MFDLFSQAQRAELIRRVLRTGVQATSDMIYLVEASTPIPASFILTPVVVPKGSGRASKALAEAAARGAGIDGAVDAPSGGGGRRSHFTHPETNGTVVGFAGVLFLWQTVLAKALPEHLSGIIAAVVSPSGAAHTYRLEGGAAVSLGQGLQLNGTFQSHERKLTADVTSDTWQARAARATRCAPPFAMPDSIPLHCRPCLCVGEIFSAVRLVACCRCPPLWRRAFPTPRSSLLLTLTHPPRTHPLPTPTQLWVYPTDTLLQTFLTKEPMLRGAFVMAMVFIASLILHSWVLLRRSQRLSTIFRATDNLVDDVRFADIRAPPSPPGFMRSLIHVSCVAL